MICSVLMPLNLSMHYLKMSFKNHLWIFGMGVSMFSTHFLFVYEATNYLVSGIIAVIFSGVSFLSVAYTAIYQRKLPKWNVLLGSILGTAGLGIFFADEMTTLAEKADTLTGVILCLIATAIFTFGGIISKHNQKENLSITASMAWGMTYGSIIMLIYALYKGTAFNFPQETDFWLSLWYLIIFGSLVAYLCYLQLIKNIGAELASYITVLTPIVALFISSHMEGYIWSINDLIGLMVVISGNILVIKKFDRS